MFVIMALTYLKKYKKDINPITTKQQDLNGFLLYYIVHYKDRKYEDTIL